MAYWRYSSSFVIPQTFSTSSTQTERATERERGRRERERGAERDDDGYLVRVWLSNIFLRSHPCQYYFMPHWHCAKLSSLWCCSAYPDHFSHTSSGLTVHSSTRTHTRTHARSRLVQKSVNESIKETSKGDNEREDMLGVRKAQTEREQEAPTRVGKTVTYIECDSLKNLWTDISTHT